VIRWSAGIIFLIFGVGKFANHAAELASFRNYPLPAPGVFVYLVGVVEVVGGLLLVLGLLTRLAAIALAADMVGAIAVSGLGRGEVISLTLAPLLLVAMISLMRLGAGAWSLDPRMAANLSRERPSP
jgi:putative oxidoreductase